MSLFALSLVAATSDLQHLPDFTLPISEGVEMPITCATNKERIGLLINFARGTEKNLKGLRKLRQKRKITLEQSNTLFQSEILITTINQTVAILWYGEHFCAHPGDLPKQEEIPSEPNT